MDRRWLIAGVGVAALIGGGWAIRAAPGMPLATTIVTSTVAGTGGLSGLLSQVEQGSAKSETQVLQQANAQGKTEITALKAAVAKESQLQSELNQALSAEASYRQQAQQAASEVAQLEAQLQAQTVSPPYYRRDFRGGDD